MEKNIILTIDDKSYKVVPDDGDDVVNCREHCALNSFCEYYNCKAERLVDDGSHYHFVELKIEK